MTLLLELISLTVAQLKQGKSLTELTSGSQQQPGADYERESQKRGSTCNSSPNILSHLPACSAPETFELQNAAEPQPANSPCVYKDNSKQMLLFCGFIKHHGRSSVKDESVPHPQPEEVHHSTLYLLLKLGALAAVTRRLAGVGPFGFL